METAKWDVLELAFHGRRDGNPFVERELTAEFTGEREKVAVKGFYDGDGIYKVRFMPSHTGSYSYRAAGSCFEGVAQHEPRSGVFRVLPPRAGNHGPVRVQDGLYLSYEDGVPYHSLGTTCYAWVNQPPALQEQTLKSLAESCFNKIRFCIFPKYYQYNEKEPFTYPYVRGRRAGVDEDKAAGALRMSFPQTTQPQDVRDFDCYRFNPEHFRRFDERIAQLAALGIEADIILFHPYDKWGFSCMEKECNELYLRYMVARYGAFRNVWWSMANEYDLLNWTQDEWDHYGALVGGEDVYRHMISVHNCVRFYDFKKDWVSHCSMQRTDLYKHVEETDRHLAAYGKPVVWDEIAYEGNIDMGWGNISGQEMVRRFYEATLRGGYAGHGETFVGYGDVLWWSHGGALHGESEPRLAFLKKIWDDVPGGRLKRARGAFDELVGIPAGEEKPSRPGDPGWCSYELHYYGFMRPSYRMLALPQDERYRLEVIDTWNMTIEDRGVHSGLTKVELPGHEWMMIRIRRMPTPARTS